MTYRWLALGLWVTFVASGCASSSTLDTYQPKDADEAMVVSSLIRIPNGVKVKSVDLIMQPYADDVYVGGFSRYLGVAGPNAPLSISKPELRDVYFQVLRSAKDISMEVKDFRLTVRGDRAVAEARTELVFKIEAGRKEARENIYRNNVTWRMRRTAAGWKIAEEVWQ